MASERDGVARGVGYLYRLVTGRQMCGSAPASFEHCTSPVEVRAGLSRRGKAGMGVGGGRKFYSR